MNRDQLMAMLWLRWRLSVNQLLRGSRVNATITMILTTIGLVLVVAGGIAGVAGGVLGLSQASPKVIMAVWAGLVGFYLFLWVMEFATELQRSESIDLSRLLHLPVSLRDVFFLNYLASHFTSSLILMLPTMLGVAVGLVLGRGGMMLWLFPLVFGFIFMMTAWTYCLRGWLAALMVNKRRRRNIVMGITMGFVLLAQLPNLVKGHVVFATWFRYIPFFWLPMGARELVEGQMWPAVWGASGMIAIGSLGLARAYRLTIRFYQGGETHNPAATSTSAQTVSFSNGKTLVDWTLPAIPEEAAALALASLRSMSRAPEIKMALLTNVILIGIFGINMFARRSGGLPSAIQPFMGSAAVAITFLGLVQVMFNHFGFDRSGFRAIVLLPTPRRHILQGKNLALLPFALGVFVINLALVTVLTHLEVLSLLPVVFEFCFAYFALSLLGNLLSIVFPYRVAAGTLKPSKQKGTTQLLILATNLLLFPLAMLPVLLPVGLGQISAWLQWLPAGTVTLFCSILMAVLSALLYWQTLEPLGRLLQRREQEILQVVTQEVE